MASRPILNILNRGQATIELSFGVILLLLTISMGTLLAISLRQHFKHDYLGQSFEPMSGFNSDKVDIEKNVILFDFKSQAKNLDRLAQLGWTQSEVKIPGNLKIFKKGNEELLLIKNLGVISCSKNCSDN